ncbi:MAG: tyrosine-type recombinase/integrase [Dehalococcoidia bacterium]
MDNPDGWLWLTDSGRHATYRTIDAAWQRDIDRAGLSGTPHLLRHVHASILLAGGMPVPEVARRLGHATPAVTLAVYAHALPGLDRGGEIASRFLPDAPWPYPRPRCRR